MSDILVLSHVLYKSSQFNDNSSSSLIKKLQQCTELGFLPIIMKIRQYFVKFLGKNVVFFLFDGTQCIMVVYFTSSGLHG